MLTAILGVLSSIGVRGAVCGAVGISIGVVVGVGLGTMRESARTDLKIEKALYEYMLERRNQEDEIQDQSDRARRDAERDFDSGELHDDPHLRD